MAVQKEKNPNLGFARDFLEVVETLLPFWERKSPLKVITNAGGLNPLACGRACKALLGDRLKIAVVTGDDVLSRVKTEKQLKTANAYLGAEPIVEALHMGADIVITGRVADPSLTVAPCIYHFGWKKEDYARLAQGTVAGHLIECGRQVTGGIATNWLELHDPVNIGFPVVDMEESGDFVVTKPKSTGGIVDEYTVAEQLLYEILDPSCYLSPDVTVDITHVTLQEVEKDQVKVTGARGSAPPATYKVSATYFTGYKAEGMVLICGTRAKEKAAKAGEVLLKRLLREGIEFEKHCVEAIGGETECFCRVAVQDANEKKVERFTKEIASLVTSGPSGTTAYATGRPPVRPVFGFLPLSIAVSSVQPKVEFL